MVELWFIGKNGFICVYLKGGISILTNSQCKCLRSSNHGWGSGFRTRLFGWRTKGPKCSTVPHNPGTCGHPSVCVPYLGQPPAGVWWEHWGPQTHPHDQAGTKDYHTSQDLQHTHTHTHLTSPKRDWHGKSKISPNQISLKGIWEKQWEEHITNMLISVVCMRKERVGVSQW